ncbi:MAG: LLM class flavin-dependent oxidoreductase, partial [Dehalococcoidia bacterium]
VREAARWMIERAAAARESGLDSLFIGDHHASPAPYYQNTPMLGRLLAEWGDNPAGCLFLLPLWNPVLAAEQIGTLASIHQGRFIMQCALGAGGSQFDGMGISLRTRPSAFEEGLDIVRRLLAGQTVSGSTRYPAIKAARIAPIPPEPVEVWIGGSVEASVDRAARIGDAWLSGPELTPALAEHWLRYYRDRCGVYEKTPAAIAIRRDVYVGETDAEAAAVAEPLIDAGYRGIEPESLIYGSVDTVVAKMKSYEARGFTDMIIRHLTDDQPKVLASMKRLGAVREALG